jgi:hypothetical protein
MNTQNRKAISTLTFCHHHLRLLLRNYCSNPPTHRVLPSAPPLFRRVFLRRRQLLITLHKATSNHSPLFATIALYREMTAKAIFVLGFVF